MSHLEKEKQKLIARIKRIRGQVDSIERSLTTGEDWAGVLMLSANVPGGINRQPTRRASPSLDVCETVSYVHVRSHRKRMSEWQHAKHADPVGRR